MGCRGHAVAGELADNKLNAKYEGVRGVRSLTDWRGCARDMGLCVRRWVRTSIGVQQFVGVDGFSLIDRKGRIQEMMSTK